MEPPVELRQLRYFVAVAEELHFGRAAKRLHMSQSPLSRAIRELERDIGAVLFIRTTRHVELTPAGSALLSRARVALTDVNAASEVRFDNDERAPLLIVGAEKDHTVPASVARAQHKKYRRSSARTDYLEFEGRPHLFIAGDGSQEVAAAIDSWLDGVLENGGG